jgi:outer membrane protein OmpA-like peptidoglycan-associated protein
MMRKVLSPALVVVLVLGLSLTGCATKKYVNEQISEFDQVTNTKIHELQDSMEGNQKQISELAANQAALAADVAAISETAKEALARADAAGVLAMGKFLYETTITDNDVTFGFNKFTLSDDAKAQLDEFAAVVLAVEGDAFVEIQGNTDNIGSESYNLELGYKRAEAAMRYLNMEKGIPMFRMNVISYGEYKPLADNSTKEGRAQNRRVTLVAMQ